jgi:hypothetical protein
MKRATVTKVGGTRRAQPAIPSGKRKTEEEKEEAAYRRSEQRAHAAQLAEKCSECGEAGKLPYSGVPALNSSPPLWLVENSWLVDEQPLCSDCIEAGARVSLCFEGGSLHQFWEVAGRTVCRDCGGDCDDRNLGAGEPVLERTRLEGAMCAREAEIGSIVRRMAIETPPEPELTALTNYLGRLREDRDWVAGQLKGSL